MKVTADKSDFFERVEKKLKEEKFIILSKDQDRPWGGFFVLKEEQAQRFSDQYFDGIDVEGLRVSGKLSPKVLVVKPHSRLSWQYHYRRAEIWRVIRGKVGVVRSFTDEEGELKVLKEGDQIELHQGERHRLVGLDDWGVVAEIWQHTDESNPSDEQDIVRVQDDFGR